MDYRAVAKNDGNELTHWKYTKRENVNGKWKYYYSTDTPKDGINKFKNEASRTVDNLKYDTQYELLRLDNGIKRNQMRDELKKGNVSNTAKAASSYALNVGKAAVNRALRLLNNVGNGKIDNKISKASNKGMSYLKKKLNIK